MFISPIWTAAPKTVPFRATYRNQLESKAPYDPPNDITREFLKSSENIRNAISASTYSVKDDAKKPQRKQHHTYRCVVLLLNGDHQASVICQCLFHLQISNVFALKRLISKRFGIAVIAVLCTDQQSVIERGQRNLKARVGTENLFLIRIEGIKSGLIIKITVHNCYYKLCPRTLVTMGASLPVTMTPNSSKCAGVRGPARTVLCLVPV